MILPRRRLIIIGVIVLGIVVVAAIGMQYFRPTYIRIVDASSIPDDKTPAPGADINAVEVLKKGSHSPVFASAIASSHILDGAFGAPNSAKDASHILGSPDTAQDPKYVSLGLGGEIVVKVSTPLRTGDQLTIDEIGADAGPHAEFYDVSTSNNPNGPWTHVGNAAGPHTFTIQ